MTLPVARHRRALETGLALHAVFSGRDGYVVMRQALRGRRSGASFPFHGRNALEGEGTELLLLWRRGKPVDFARQKAGRDLARPGCQPRTPRPRPVFLRGDH